MKKIPILLLIFVYNFVFSQVQFGEDEEQKPEYLFAVKLLPDPHGSTVICAIIKSVELEKWKDTVYFDAGLGYNVDGFTTYLEHSWEVQFMSRETWAKQLSGYQLSNANPVRRHNIALEKKIYTQPSNFEDLTEDEQEDWTTQRIVSILDNLWRLRYTEYPFKEDPEFLNWKKAVDEERAKRDSVLGNDTRKEIREKIQDDFETATTPDNKKLAVGEFDWTRTEVNFDPGQRKKEEVASKTSLGWTTNENERNIPSTKQMEYLCKNYNYCDIREFIYDENLFKLMKDMLDKNWQNSYKSIQGDRKQETAPKKEIETIEDDVND